MNPQLIKDAVEKRGDNGLAKLSAESGLSISLLSKLMAGSYTKGMRERTAKTLCEAIGIKTTEDLYLGEEAS